MLIITNQRYYSGTSPTDYPISLHN